MDSRFVSAALAVAVAVVPAAAQDGWKRLTGEKMPELNISRWLNTGDEQPTVATLKGKVWLLEFFATW